jgi:hypothetical protein
MEYPKPKGMEQILAPHVEPPIAHSFPLLFSEDKGPPSGWVGK